MAIKFICTCGKHLRARDEMAARRSCCPRCGRPVGIPSRSSTQRGVPEGPLTPDERLRTRRVVPPTGMPDEPPRPTAADAVIASAEAQLEMPKEARPRLPIDTHAVRQAVARPAKKTRGGWQMETRWFHCLLFPLRAGILVLGQSILLTALSAAIVLLIPEYVHLREVPWLWLIAGFGLLIPLVAAGYACGFLDCVLASAMAGEVQCIRWPGRNLGLAMKSGLTWIVCFLAGPIVPAALALWFWINTGQLTIADWLIISELVLLAVSYWLLGVAAVGQRDRILDANPARVADLVERLGWPGLAAVSVCGLLFIAFGALLVIALVQVHLQPMNLIWLVSAWLGGLCVATFLFRLIGVWCYWKPMPAPAQPSLQ